jgi:hypothetical protein
MPESQYVSWSATDSSNAVSRSYPERQSPRRTVRKAKGLILVYSGQISHKEMLDVRATFGNDSPEVEKCRFLLVDLTDAALAQISTDAPKELAGLHSVLAEHTFTGMPVAVFATRDLEYGLSRMWQVFVGGKRLGNDGFSLAYRG